MDIADPSDTLVMVGAALSIINPLEKLIELATPGSASVKLATFPAASKIVPLLNASAVVLA